MEAQQETFKGNNYQECIYDCLQCHEACLTCVPHCLRMGGEHATPSHIGLLLNCAEVCRTAVALMSTDSSFSFEFCQLCARICEACAESCDRIDPGDSVMQECVNACRKCAESCRNMAH